MKKAVLIVICLFALKLQAQQFVHLTDSTVVAVLDSFIRENRLDDKRYKVITIALKSFDKDFLDSGKTIGGSKTMEVPASLIFAKSFSFDILYETDEPASKIYPVTYYTFHRKVPVLLSSGFGDMIAPNRKAQRRLRSAIKKHVDPYGFGPPPSVWFVTVKYKTIQIDKR